VRTLPPTSIVCHIGDEEYRAKLHAECVRSHRSGLSSSLKSFGDASPLPSLAGNGDESDDDMAQTYCEDTTFVDRDRDRHDGLNQVGIPTPISKHGDHEITIAEGECAPQFSLLKKMGQDAPSLVKPREKVDIQHSELIVSAGRVKTQLETAVGSDLATALQQLVGRNWLEDTAVGALAAVRVSVNQD